MKGFRCGQQQQLRGGSDEYVAYHFDPCHRLIIRRHFIYEPSNTNAADEHGAWITFYTDEVWRPAGWVGSARPELQCLGSHANVVCI